MKELEKRIKFLKKWETGLEKKLLTQIQRNSHLAEDLITDDQLFSKGIRGDGQSLGEYRSSEYTDLKRQLNPAGVVDLKLSGDLHESVFTDADRFPVLFDFKDWKRNELFAKYGEEISELTPENIEEFTKIVNDELADEYKSELTSL